MYRLYIHRGACDFDGVKYVEKLFGSTFNTHGYSVILSGQDYMDLSPELG